MICAQALVATMRIVILAMIAMTMAIHNLRMIYMTNRTTMI